MKYFLVLPALLMVGFSFNAKCQNSVPQGMFHPNLGGGADPWIIKDNGFYYLCQAWTVGGDKFISVSKSARLSTANKNKVTVWHEPTTGWNSGTLWAPELHHIGNKWYIYYSAGKSGPPFIYQRAGVLESVTEDPQGKYIDRGMLNTGVDNNDPTGTIWAIDMTVGKINGQMYAVWSGWDRNAITDKTQQNLYMAKMSNPWTISSPRVKLASPDRPWETGGPLNLEEGPEFLKHDGHIFIIYSTRESWTPQYRLGQLTLSDSTSSILNPGNWQKKGPVFMGTDKVYGVGHASFTTSPDGSQWWIVYHTKVSPAPGWQRFIRLQPFTWKMNGDPDFGVPFTPGKLLPLPSGEQSLN